MEHTFMTEDTSTLPAAEDSGNMTLRPNELLNKDIIWYRRLWKSNRCKNY